MFRIHLQNFIGLQLMYSSVLGSGVQQSESVIHIHVSTFFKDVILIIFKQNLF